MIPQCSHDRWRSRQVAFAAAEDPETLSTRSASTSGALIQSSARKTFSFRQCRIGVLYYLPDITD